MVQYTNEKAFYLLNRLLSSSESVSKKENVLAKEFGVQTDPEFDKNLRAFATAAKDCFQRGMKIGRIEASTGFVKQLISKEALSAIEAVEYLDVPAELREQILAFVSGVSSRHEEGFVPSSSVGYGYLMDGVETGRIEASAIFVRHLVFKRGISATEAMEYLDIPLELRKQVLTLIALIDYAEGYAEGYFEVIVQHVKRLMSEMGLSTVEAMKILDIPADQHEQILALLSYGN